MVKNRDGEDLFGLFLPNHKLIQVLDDLLHAFENTNNTRMSIWKLWQNVHMCLVCVTCMQKQVPFLGCEALLFGARTGLCPGSLESL